MSSYRKTMAEALQEVSDKNKLKVLARKIKRFKDKAFKRTFTSLKSPLFADNEIEEGRMKDIFTADQEGKSAEEIAKIMKLPLKTVKGILGESDAYDNERYEIRGGIAYKDIGNTPDKKNHVYAPDKKTAEKIFKQGKKVFREAGIKPYVSMQRSQATGKMNYVVLDKDEKEAFRSTDQRVATDYWKKNYDKLKEEVIVEFSDSMLDKLKKEYEPLKGKTISVDQANKLRKIFNMIPDRALDALRKKKIPFLSGLALSRMVQKGMPVKEELEETSQGFALVQKAKAIAKKMAGNYSGAVKEIEKLKKGLSDVYEVELALKAANEELEEKKSAFRISYSKDGQHAGFEDADTLQQIQRAAANLRMKGFTIDKMGRNTSPVKEDNEKEEPKKDNEKKESENKDNTISSLKDQIAMLKTKLENEKNKAVKPEPNPDTGEVPLTVGVAYKHFKDKKEKEEVKKEVKETVSIKAYKNAVDPSKKGLMISKSGGMSGTIMIKDKKELKDLETKIAQAKRLYNIKESDLEEATKNTDFKVKMKTPSGMRTVRVTVPIKDFVVDMAKIEDAARRKVKGDMVNFDFASDIKMEADLNKKQIKMVHKVADDLPKKDFKDRYGKEKGDAVRFGTATNMVKKKLGMENTSAFNPSVHNKTLGVTSKDLDRAFRKLSQKAQSHVNDLLRTGMGTRDAIKKAKEKFKENNINEDRRLYVESLAGLKKKSEKSGMPYSILKKVFDRGMAAWKSGHRPGASQQQWAYARVNSFITKSSGTWGGADKDLAKQVRGK